MRGNRVLALCGVVLLLSSAGCDSVKEGVQKVVQRFRPADTTKADTTKVAAVPVRPAPDTTAAKAPATGTKAGATKTPQTAAKTPAGATKAAPQTTTTTPGTAARTPGTASKTATAQPAAATKPASMAAAPATKPAAAPATKPTTAPAAAQTTAQQTTTAPRPVNPASRAMQAAAPPSLTDAEKEALDDLGSQYATEFELHPGWFRDRAVQYYDFGPTPQPIAPGRVIWPIHGFDAHGLPVAMRGQRPIFSSIPGVGAYSGLWRLTYLIVADHVTSNELRDETAADMLVRRHRAFLKATDQVLNLPVVAHGSRLAGDSTRATYGWYQGREVQYFDFGAGSLGPVPLFAFTTATDANGDPVFLQSQGNVVDTIPVRAPYPDLWSIQFVRVDSTYRPNAWRNASAVVSGGAKIESSHSWRNCPVVIVDNARLARAASPLRLYADDRSPLPPSPTIIP